MITRTSHQLLYVYIFVVAGKAEIRVWSPGAKFMQRTEVWCASIGLPPGVACRAGVRKAPVEVAPAPRPSAGTTVCATKTKSMGRFVHL
jgi:hypothetical protein